MLLAAVSGALMLPCDARGASSAANANLTLNDYEIKAAALYNIVAFTNWPESAFTQPDSPLVIGIVGRGPIATVITNLVRNETWHGRKVVVEPYTPDRTIKSCQVLFVAESEREDWDRIRTECAHRAVLVISDGDDFAAQGGSVQLSIAQNKLHILVNLAAIRASGLQLSSNLLHLATIVGPRPDSMGSPRARSGLMPGNDTSRVFAVAP